MSTRRESLFKAGTGPVSSDVIPATVKHEIDKSRKELRILTPEEKMLCALRKALADMSDGKENFYIAENKVQLTRRPTTTEGKKGEPQSYQAAGRCKVGICREENTVSFKVIGFRISYRDIMKATGLSRSTVWAALEDLSATRSPLIESVEDDSTNRAHSYDLVVPAGTWLYDSIMETRDGSPNG